MCSKCFREEQMTQDKAKAAFAEAASSVEAHKPVAFDAPSPAPAAPPAEPAAMDVCPVPSVSAAAAAAAAAAASSSPSPAAAAATPDGEASAPSPSGNKSNRCVAHACAAHACVAHARRPTRGWLAWGAACLGGGAARRMGVRRGAPRGTGNSARSGA
jgi:hypothetical protein